MKAIGLSVQTLLFLTVWLFSPVLAWSDAVVRWGTAATALELDGIIDVFKTDLGGVDNGIGGGPFTSGYRGVTWDEVPDGAAAPNGLPADYYLNTVPVGLSLSTPGSGFQVSATTASGIPVRFGNIDPSYTSLFPVYSQEQLFTPVGDIVTDITFFVPGQPTVPAYVSGFGAVFLDVDEAFQTSIELFDLEGSLLDAPFALPQSGGFSFVGATFDGGEQLARVRITSGTAALGNGILEGGGIDLVVMDNFYFGEPIAVPEPRTLALLGASLLGLFAMRYWRRT